MEPFLVHILGCGSAQPTLRHNPTSQVIEIRGKLFMIDCGEGTQLQLRRSKISFMRIQAVFISHLHGDHCLGLVGMISTFSLLGRTAPLHIYAPTPLQALLSEQMKFFCAHLDYDVVFHTVDTSQPATIYEDRSLTVSTIPLDHRIPCAGFLFREKASLPHIRPEMLEMYGISRSMIHRIKAGEDGVAEDGSVIPNERLTIPADAPRSYAYCSDTRFKQDLIPLLEGVDTLYHESTYTKDLATNAKKYYHSTAEEAATIAREAKVGKLLLGHYSARYDDLRPLLEEARSVFPQAYLTNEGETFDVGGNMESGD